MSRLLAFLLVATTAAAQATPLAVAVPSAGGGRAVSAAAENVRALDLLAAATAAHGAPLKCDGPALERLSATRITIDRPRIGLEELALLVAVSGDVQIEFEGEALVAKGIAAGDEGAVLRTQAAMRHAEFARTAYPDAAFAAELSAARGRLAFEIRDYATAYESFQGVRPTELDAATVQELRLWAAEAALRAGRLEEALAGVQAIERAPIDLPAIPGAELLSARVLIAHGDLAGGAVRLRRALGEARYPRDRALAALLLAETAWRQGDGRGMLAALEKFGEGARRAYPDLARRTSFITALALSLLAKHDAAVVHFRLALRDDPDAERRARAARAAAEELRTAGRLFEALLAARQARAVAPVGKATVRAAILEAELLAALGLADRALNTAAEALAAIPEPGPESDRLLEIAATAAVESGRREAADAAMAAIARRPGLRPRARRLQVELYRRTGRPVEALAVLDALLPEEIPAAGYDAPTLARLKSELALAAGDPMRAAREIESLPPPAEKTP